MSVDYDLIAPAFDRRYDRDHYEGIRTCLHGFVDGEQHRAVAEVGCGTGHWLADMAALPGVRTLLGLDLSPAMLEKARVAAPRALLVQGTAAQVPWATACVDRVLCVNALHHFPEPQAFIAECRRILRRGGGVLTIGLDPHAGSDEWWVYDFFPAAMQADLRRFASSATIRDWLGGAGFRDASTRPAQDISFEMPFDAASSQGLLDRRSASQLMVISDSDYATGLRRLTAERPALRAHLRLYATTAWASPEWSAT